MKIDYKGDVESFREKFGPFTIEQQQAVVEEESLELVHELTRKVIDPEGVALECVDKTCPDGCMEPQL